MHIFALLEQLCNQALQLISDMLVSIRAFKIIIQYVHGTDQTTNGVEGTEKGSDRKQKHIFIYCKNIYIGKNTNLSYDS